jgi:hypothetical protein
MTEAQGTTREAASGVVMARPASAAPDLSKLAHWSRRHAVTLAALILILASLAWKAQLLTGLYFVRDDFHDLDLAIEHPLTWSYLTYIWDGHLIIGLRLIAWLMVRTSLYNWGLACTVTMTFTAAASLACYRALRTLFGDNPRILLLLAFYLLSPLTVATFGWWSSAMESVPLQLAIFMAVASHVLYVRTGRTRHLVAAALWMTFGLIFFEKALALPLLLFAITAAFLVERRSLAQGALTALRRFRWAWVTYLGIMLCYSAILAAALSTSISRPQAPPSAGSVLALVADLLRNSFFPGAFGGPWEWYPDNSYAIGAPPPFMAWLSVLLGVAIIVVSVLKRRSAWRAWATVAGWILVADLLPLFVGRIGSISTGLLGLDIRYVADAAPVLTICLGLAFWRLQGSRGPEFAGAATPDAAKKLPEPLRMAVVGVAAIFVLGSVVSVHELGTTVSGASTRSYIANASEAVRSAPRGTKVVDWPAPDTVVPSVFGHYSYTSAVIGDLAIGKLHWISVPTGTIDNLYRFGSNGELYPVWVGPTASLHRSNARGCWPVRNGQILVPFYKQTSIFTWILRIGYLKSPGPAAVTVTYGTSTKTLTLLPGLHTAFLPEQGAHITSITVGGPGVAGLCVGDVEAGQIEASPFSKPIP